MKMKLDKDVIKEFFIDNVEKMIFGVVIACFLVLTVKAALRRGYPKAPKDLEAACSTVEQKIQNAKGELPDITRQIKPYDTIVQGLIKIRSDAAAQEKFYELPSRFDPDPFHKRPPRGEPGLLPVAELRATAGMGTLTVMKPAAGGGKPVPAIHGQRWVVLVAKVPVAEQAAEFQRCFRDANYQRPKTDVPQYSGFVVQRAEVPDSGDTRNLKWTTQFTSAREMENAKAKFGEPGPDVVESRYTRPKMTFPLPKRMDDQRWGADVASAPDIPVVAKEKASDEPATKPETEPQPKPGDLDLGGAPPADGVAAKPAHAAAGAAAAAAAESESEKDKQVKYLLLRFFDFTVQPGQTYCYRVFPLLSNPNLGIDPKELVSPELATGDYLGVAQTRPLKVKDEKMWATTSGSISIPRDIRLHPLLVTPVDRTNVEAMAQIQIEKWLEEYGVRAKFDFLGQRRTQILDFYKVPVKIKMPKGSEEAPAAKAAPPAKHKPAPPKTARKEIKVDFVTNSLLVDMMGGDVIQDGGDDRRPAEILLLENLDKGRPTLVIHSEFEGPAEAAEPTEAEPGAGEGEEPAPPAAKSGGTPSGLDGLEGDDGDIGPKPKAKRPRSKE
jgi:hypothetical protein